MKFTINYSISEIFEKVSKHIETPEILFLSEKIEAYRKSMNNRIHEAIQRCNNVETDNLMRWIQENVETDIKRYVIWGIKDNSFDEYAVLKRSSGKWKTISEIGVEVCVCDKEARDYSEWFNYWNLQSDKISQLNVQVYETHAHYNLKNYKDIYERVVEVVHNAGVKKIVIPAVDFSTCYEIKKCFDKENFQYVYYGFGSHPKYIWKEEWDDSKWKELEQLLGDDKCVALGECGLDYSYSQFTHEHREKQLQMFNKFIDVANANRLPMILHVRPADSDNICAFDADSDALKILQKNHIHGGAVLHCFGGTIDEVEAYMEAGVTHFGIGGRICYGHEEFENAVKLMPEESILLETDSPYIRVGIGNIPNTSLSLYDIATKIAELRNTTIEHIFELTYRNAEEFFGNR